MLKTCEVCGAECKKRSTESPAKYRLRRYCSKACVAEASTLAYRSLTPAQKLARRTETPRKPLENFPWRPKPGLRRKYGTRLSVAMHEAFNQHPDLVELLEVRS